jgi:NADH-ubiquinone oxidoreductase chain 4L
MLTIQWISVIWFIIGILGIIINRKNLILMLISIELMLLAINILFFSSSINFDNLTGQIFALYILVIAAAESAIGLSILITYYRVTGTITIHYNNLLKG